MLSLALGIGATTAIYSLVDQVMLHALPVRQPEQLVLVDWRGEQLANGFGSYNLMSYPICGDLQGQTQIFDGVLCRAATTVNLSTGSEPKPAGAEIVSGSYFAVLGVGAAMGRVLGLKTTRPLRRVRWWCFPTTSGRRRWTAPPMCWGGRSWSTSIR